MPEGLPESDREENGPEGDGAFVDLDSTLMWAGKCQPSSLAYCCSQTYRAAKVVLSFASAGLPQMYTSLNTHAESIYQTKVRYVETSNNSFHNVCNGDVVALVPTISCQSSMPESRYFISLPCVRDTRRMATTRADMKRRGARMPV